MKKKYFGHIEIPLKRVHIELTNVCGFNCVFCPKSEMKRPFGFMETDLAKSIITEIGKNRICEKITFHVMGEPTMHHDFFQILEHAQSEKVNVGLTTNGSGLGGTTGKRLLDYDLYQIDVSLQTPDDKSFLLRKAGALSFEDYLKGILDFFSSYSARGRETIFKFRFLNTRFRRKGMEDKKGPVRIISSTKELRSAFRYLAGQIYDIIGVNNNVREKAMRRIDQLVSYKWNVVEIYTHVFFETYILDDWGHAFDDEKIHNAWAGYCFGMRDHFGILYNGDVVLCCMDINGCTALGNLHNTSFKEVLSSDYLGEIIDGFKRFRVLHPHCKRCLGSTTIPSWLFKPPLSIMTLKVLKPFFYKHTSLFR
ncbi:radical SAM/SPASM domain-containing protein [bacterium]|nr:MAG: radical SAM/SPASM domain-containing protein [bacterium]